MRALQEGKASDTLLAKVLLRSLRQRRGRDTWADYSEHYVRAHGKDAENNEGLNSEVSSDDGWGTD